MNKPTATFTMPISVGKLFIKWYGKYYKKTHKAKGKKILKPYDNPHFLKGLSLRIKREEIIQLKRIESKNNREQQIAYYMRVLQMRNHSVS